MQQSYSHRLTWKGWTGFTIVLALTFSGCFGPPRPLPPEEALQQTSSRIDRILDTAHTPGSVIPDRAVTLSDGPLEFWRHAHPVLDQAFAGPQGQKRFEQQLRPHRIQSQFIGEWHFAVQKLSVTMAAGDLPDVTTVARGWVAPLAQSGRLLPLDTVLDSSIISDLPTPVRNAFSIDDRLYAIPLGNYCSVLLYNTEMIGTPPKTWDELRTVAQTLRAENPSERFHPIGHLPYIEALWSTGGRVVFGAQSGLERPEALETLEFLLELRDDELLHPRTMNDPQWALSMFLRGQVAMTVISSRDWPLVDEMPAAMAPIPGRDAPVTRLMGDAVVAFAEAEDKRSDIAALLEHLIGPEIQGAASASKGSVPARTSVAETIELPPGLAEAYGHARSEPLHRDWDSIELEAIRGLDRAFRWRNEGD